MAKIIPVPVKVAIGVPGGIDGRGEPRYFGRFSIVPYATARNGSLDIDRWMLLDSDGYGIDLNDRLLFSVMPRKLLCHVCQVTFEEEDRPTVDVIIEIDDERWTYPMRAREVRPEEVHYEIEIEHEWMLLTDAYVGDLLGSDHFAFAEREVLPSIDFGHEETVISEMM